MTVRCGLLIVVSMFLGAAVGVDVGAAALVAIDTPVAFDTLEPFEI